MGSSTAHTFLSDILHAISQGLLAPDIILLLAFIAYALFSIGSVAVEFFTERRHFKVVMPQFLAALTEASEGDIPQVIDSSGLLNRQKEALRTVYEYRNLPGDALVALVKRLVSEEETRYDRITGHNGTAAKVAPMLGLMGTLIPLGPGIEALGRADTSALSSSLLIAFDTTVAGLLTAAVCLIIGKVRSNWYEDYLSALDAAMATMIEKIEGAREQGGSETAGGTVAAGNVVRSTEKIAGAASPAVEAVAVASSAAEAAGELSSPAESADEAGAAAEAVYRASSTEEVVDTISPAVELTGASSQVEEAADSVRPIVELSDAANSADEVVAAEAPMVESAEAAIPAEEPADAPCPTAEAAGMVDAADEAADAAGSGEIETDEACQIEESTSAEGSADILDTPDAQAPESTPSDKEEPSFSTRTYRSVDFPASPANEALGVFGIPRKTDAE